MLQVSEYTEICYIRIPSVSFADSVPTPIGPSGHFPLTGGIGPLCPRGALGAPAPVLHGKKSFKCYSLVGADDSVGPLGSYGFAAVFRKIGVSRRVDVGIDPYNWRSA